VLVSGLLLKRVLLLMMEWGHLHWDLLWDHSPCHIRVHCCERLPLEGLLLLREHAEVHLLLDLRDLSLLQDWL
jgi:hypothetical protein